MQPHKAARVALDPQALCCDKRCLMIKFKGAAICEENLRSEASVNSDLTDMHKDKYKGESGTKSLWPFQ